LDVGVGVVGTSIIDAIHFLVLFMFHMALDVGFDGLLIIDSVHF
jgi:hypothetical protein